MKATAALILAILLFAATADAAEQPKPFARAAAVKLLGYDPERSIAGECQTRTNTLSIVRVGLVKTQPFADRLRLFLTVVGMTGAARAICPAADAPEKPRPFAKPGEILAAADCDAAGAFLTGKMKETLNAQIDSEHPDLAIGFMQGVIDALPSLRDACEPHENAWARIAGQEQILTSQMEAQRKARTCNLWRRAFYAEVRTASALAETKGKTAGLAYLKSKPPIALTGVSTLCGGEYPMAGEAYVYDLTRTTIEAMPK